MGLNFLNLATKGMDAGIRMKILKRHLFSLLRHITFKKFVNLLLTEYNLALKKEVVSSKPYILKIEPSNICNLKCAYCYDNRRAPKESERPYGRMSFNNFKQLIDETGTYLLKINLYGFGEPFLFPETFEMIEYATRNNIGVTVSSNMNFTDSTLIDKILHSGLEILIFSCHGVTPSSYSKFMVKGNMDLAFANIKSLIAAKKKNGSKTPLIDWQFCVTKFNQDELDMAKEKANQLGIDQIRFIKPMFPDHADDDFFSDLFPAREDSVMVQAKCSWLYRAAYINYDGGVLPCCRDTRSVANDFGNVFQEKFSAIWNNKKYRSSRKYVALPGVEKKQCKTMCRQCPHVMR